MQRNKQIKQIEKEEIKMETNNRWRRENNEGEVEEWGFVIQKYGSKVGEGERRKGVERGRYTRPWEPADTHVNTLARYVPWYYWGRIGEKEGKGGMWKKEG